MAHKIAMNTSNPSDRRWAVENIPAIGEVNACISTILDDISSLPSVLCNIVMNYFEGVYADEIINVIKNIQNYPRHYMEWLGSLRNIVKYKWDSHERMRQFTNVIYFLDLPHIWRCDKLDTEMMNYLSSIYRVDCSKLEYINKCRTCIEMVNAIYILIFIVMQKRTNSSLHNNMPVWDIGTSQFISLGLRTSNMPMYPEYNSDD